MELHKLTAHQLLDLIAKKKTSPREIAQDLLERIEQTEGRVKAFCSLDKEDILAQCKELEKRSSKDGKLFGIPVVIKDNICVEGQAATCASRILEGFRPPYDATCVQRLKAEGALIFARANMDEFALGSSCETSCYGPTHNPWDLERIPGGSSGGSAASVAVDETILALGSDTGGSIRQPASLCGVVGLKPTYGRVSRYGLIALAPSLEQIGPLTKDVSDAALLMNVISGHDPMDSTCAEEDVPDYTRSLCNDVKDIKVAVPREFFAKGLDAEVGEAVDAALDLLKDLGVQVKEISLPYAEFFAADYYLIATVEAASNLARFDGVRYGYRSSCFDNIFDMYRNTRGEGFGEEIKRRIILGTHALSSSYYNTYCVRALKARQMIKNDFDRIFKDFQCIITPTSSTTAFKIGERTEDPLAMSASDSYTSCANLAGLPAVSVPCGFSRKGLPIGLQIIAAPFAEESIFRLAYTFEQNTDWHLKKPKL